MRTILQLLTFVFAASSLHASVPPEVVEVDRMNASTLGFQIEKKIIGNTVEFDVSYPDQIDEWDIPQTPRILVSDRNKKTVIETYAVSKVARDLKSRPLRFGFSCEEKYEVTITFWYQSEIRGEASKGFRIKTFEFPKNHE